MDPELSGMLRVHLTGAQLRSQWTFGEPMFGGLLESLAMETVEALPPGIPKV